MWGFIVCTLSTKPKGTNKDYGDVSKVSVDVNKNYKKSKYLITYEYWILTMGVNL